MFCDRGNRVELRLENHKDQLPFPSPLWGEGWGEGWVLKSTQKLIPHTKLLRVITQPIVMFLPDYERLSTGSLRFTEEKPLNDVFCALSAAFSLALSACVYDSSRTTTTPEKLP
jgi:hypothetical protein